MTLIPTSVIWEIIKSTSSPFSTVILSLFKNYKFYLKLIDKKFNNTDIKCRNSLIIIAANNYVNIKLLKILKLFSCILLTLFIIISINHFFQFSHKNYPISHKKQMFPQHF